MRVFRTHMPPSPSDSLDLEAAFSIVKYALAIARFHGRPHPEARDHVRCQMDVAERLRNSRATAASLRQVASDAEKRATDLEERGGAVVSSPAQTSGVREHLGVPPSDEFMDLLGQVTNRYLRDVEREPETRSTDHGARDVTARPDSPRGTEDVRDRLVRGETVRVDKSGSIENAMQIPPGKLAVRHS